MSYSIPSLRNKKIRIQSTPKQTPESLDFSLRTMCENFNFENVKQLISQGANVTEVTASCACSGGSLKIVKYILKKLKRHYDINSLLYTACFFGRSFAVIKYLIRCGATKFDRGFEAACNGNHFQLIKFFIKLGANNFDLGLVKACRHKNLKLVNLMIFHKADLNCILMSGRRNNKNMRKYKKYLIEKGYVYEFRKIRTNNKILIKDLKNEFRKYLHY